MSEDHKKRLWKVRFQAHLNAAFCYLQSAEFEKGKVAEVEKEKDSYPNPFSDFGMVHTEPDKEFP